MQKSELFVGANNMRDVDKLRLRASGGLWEDAEAVVLPPHIHKRLPLVCDRYYEARHFAELIFDLLRPEPQFLNAANWYNTRW
jgi:hypothetical protein